MDGLCIYIYVFYAFGMELLILAGESMGSAVCLLVCLLVCLFVCLFAFLLVFSFFR